MNRVLASLVCGLLFGVGLAISGMTDPQKVLGFLDVTGNFNPALMFVMIGAIGVYLPLYRLIRRRARPLADAQFHIGDETRIDRRLVVGATLFGLGWGWAGFCPGPAVVSLASGMWPVGLFVGAMVGGMLLEQLLTSRSSASQSPSSPNC